MKLQATFQGRNGSLGYATGHSYALVMRELRGLVEVRRADGHGRCIYSSVLAFMRNWKNVSPV